MDVHAVAGLSMQDDLTRAENVSQNITNTHTPGYRRRIGLSAPFDLQLGVAGASAERRGRATTVIDQTPSALKFTGVGTDVAIEGTSFFEISTPDGVFYSRGGSLHVDVQGKLVNQSGFPVHGGGGEIVLANAPFALNPNGDIVQGDRIAGRLKLVQFERRNDMSAVGDGLYAIGGARISEAANSDTVRSGYQETSNTSTPHEMVMLTETVRHFESMQKIVQWYDDSLEKTIRKLGDF